MSDTTGRPVTKQSNRLTDRAPHMGIYVRAGKLWGNLGVHIVIENQAFFLPTGDDAGDDGAPSKRATWTRDMLCIALDRLVDLEIERRKAMHDGAES